MNEVHIDVRNWVFDTVLNLNIAQDDKPKDPQDGVTIADPFQFLPPS